MNWNIPRETVKANTNIFKSNPTFSNQWRNHRTCVLDKTKNTCRYCGGYYDKFLICINLNENNKMNVENYDTCCKICYTIENLNYGFFKDIKFYYSRLDQLTIVRKTVNYFLVSGKLPRPEEIDPEIKKLDLGVLEIINLMLNDAKEIYKYFPDIKVFINKDFDVSFLKNCNKGYMFLNEQNEYIDKPKQDLTIPTIKFTDEQKQFLKNYFI